MKAWQGDLTVGMLGDLQAMFSSVAGRVQFTFHIWILGPSEVMEFHETRLPFLFGFLI